MHTEHLLLEGKLLNHRESHHSIQTIFHFFSSKESKPRMTPKADSYLEKRVWELVPENGLERTFQILLNEGTHVSFVELSHIAAKKFGENNYIKPKQSSSTSEM